MKGSDMSGATAANSNVENAVKASDSVQPEEVESWEADYEDNYEDNLQMIIDWCEKIKTVEDPTDEEWEVIKACEEVAEHFSQEKSYTNHNKKRRSGNLRFFAVKIPYYSSQIRKE